MTPVVPTQLRPGGEGGFERVYRAYVRDVYGFSLGIVGNADDAEDVTQTTFLNAYRALERGEEVRNLRAWLLAIAHNVCRQRFRTAARRPKEVELDAEAAEAFVDDDAPTAAEIRTAMRELSFNQRTVLVLRELEGLSYHEIAQAMGISHSAVETLLFRARRALREQLEAAERDLGCDAVERLISLQLEGKLSRQDKGLLRAHLRTCPECARFARSRRARRRVLPGVAAVPLPQCLPAAGTGTGGGLVTAKAAAVAVGAVLVGGGALVEGGVVRGPGKEPPAEPAAAVAAPAQPPAGSPAASVGRIFAARAGTPPAARPAAARTRGKPGQAEKGDTNRTSGGSGGSAATGPVTASASSVPASGSSGTGTTAADPAAAATAPLAPVAAPEAPSVAAPEAPSVAAPEAPSVPDVVAGAQDKIPPPAGSLPLAPPSLPPVEVPDATGVLP